MSIIINTVIWARCIAIGYTLGHQNGYSDGYGDGAIKQCQDNRHEIASRYVDVFKEGLRAGGESILKTLLHDKYITEEQRKEAREILDESTNNVNYTIID